MPSVRSPLKVTIANGGQGEPCDARCGLDWSSAETVALARQRVNERFGERVQLEYVDLSGPTSQLSLALVQRIKNEELSLPLLLIDGEVRISGNFDFRLLLDTIDAALEMRQ